MNAIVVGAGCFGLTAALELRARRLDVTVIDLGPVPHPLAESTDISKVVRIDYGADEDYVELGERAIDGWRRWNARWPRPLFHETGVTFLSRTVMTPGGFEHDSFDLLRRRGHPLERLDAAAIATRFPAYRPGALVDGYFNPIGGWAESGAVITELADEARRAGVDIREGCAVASIVDDGVDLATGASRRAELVVVCAGSWVPRLLPELAPSLVANGQPVFHVRPDDPSSFDAHRFPVFGADISRTGFYGFPVVNGVVKIANHGTGTTITSDDQRVVTAAHEAALRAFLADTFPALVDAPVVHHRLCVYGDTRDGHFWIARHPHRPNLVVATGGSGHAFKFAPVLGGLIADIALDESRSPRSQVLAHKFRWRPVPVSPIRGDAARAET